MRWKWRACLALRRSQPASTDATQQLVLLSIHSTKQLRINCDGTQKLLLPFGTHHETAIHKLSWDTTDHIASGTHYETATHKRDGIQQIIFLSEHKTKQRHINCDATQQITSPWEHKTKQRHINCDGTHQIILPSEHKTKQRYINCDGTLAVAEIMYATQWLNIYNSINIIPSDNNEYRFIQNDWQ